MNRSKLARFGLGNSADELTHPHKGRFDASAHRIVSQLQLCALASLADASKINKSQIMTPTVFVRLVQVA